MLEPVLAQLLKNYPDKVRVVYRNFPLAIHDKSLLSAQAAEAVGKQNHDMYFKMASLLFEKQNDWAGLSVDAFTPWLVDQVKALGLDSDQFTKDMNSDEIVKKVKADQDNGLAIGLPGTPFLLVNGVPYQGPRDYGNLEAILKLLGLEKIQFTECPAMTIDATKQYQATLHTSKGDIVIQLYADKAPMAVNSFIFLAKKGWYDNVTFHRVIGGFVAQTGDPTGTGFGGPGYMFSNEIDPTLTFNDAGVVGMANSGSPNSNGSQFFITFAALSQLDGKYTIFGKVISGMDVAKNLTVRDPSSTQTPLPDPDKIISVSIEEK